MKEIKLYNRYGDDNRLVQVDEHMYILKFDKKSSTHFRVGLKEGSTWEDHEYCFVDPSGGPFIEVGVFKIDDKPVKYIYEKEKQIVLEV